MEKNISAALGRALRSAEPLEALEALTLDHPSPAELMPVVLEHYLSASADQRYALVSCCLRLVPGDESTALMMELLARVRGRDAAALLQVLTSRRVRVPEAQLWRLLADRETRRPAIAAAGVSGWASLAPALAEHLNDRDVGRHAAIALGHMRATTYTEAIASRLRRLEALDRSGFIAALELLGDRAAIPYLRKALARARPDEIPNLHLGLFRLSGREPLLPINVGATRDWARAVKRLWADLDLDEPARPDVRDVEFHGRASVRLVVDDGLGRIRVDYDEPLPGATWPRWARSLLVNGQRVYGVGSTCGTCETVLRLVGWPDASASDLARQAREGLEHVPAIRHALVTAMSPLLRAMRTGHYRMQLVELDLEDVDPDPRAWRPRADLPARFRSMTGPWNGQSLGTHHFRLRTRPALDDPAFLSIVPTRPPDTLDLATVDRYRAAIAADRRPACVLYGWAQRRARLPWKREGDDENQSYSVSYLVAAAHDGHHKLRAYIDAGLPARCLLICRIEDSDQPGYLDEQLAALPVPVAD